MLRLRRAVGENQCEFWSRYGVKQSVCSRYESGRALPRALRVLIHLHLSGTITDEALAGAVAAQRLDSDVE
jgi:hypothetical protein